MAKRAATLKLRDLAPYSSGRLSVVGDEDLAVLLPVFRYLLAVGRKKGAVAGRLCLDDAT